jgi:hypothetical protein
METQVQTLMVQDPGQASTPDDDLAPLPIHPEMRAGRVQLSSATVAPRHTHLERRSFVRRFLRNRTAAAGLILLVLFALLAALAPWIVPHPPKARYFGMQLAPPGAGV